MTLAERPVLLRPDEAAELLGISRSKVYSLVANGLLPSVRLTGSVRIPRAALMQMVELSTSWPVEPKTTAA